MLYIIITILFTIFAFGDVYATVSTKKRILFLFFSLLVLLGGIRWRTGTDWIPYEFLFRDTTSLDKVFNSVGGFEIGFTFLNFVINKIFGTYTAFLLVFTFLKVYFKWKVITSKLFVNYAFLSFFLFFCYTIGDVFGTRQALAVSISFYSIFSIINKDRRQFFILMILAALMHKTAIIFFISYFLFYKRFSSKFLLLTFFGSFVTGITLYSMNASYVITQIPILSSMDMFKEKITAYSELDNLADRGSVDSATSIIIGFVKKVVVLIPLLMFRKNIKYNTTIYNGLLNLLYFGAVIYLVLGSVVPEFKRATAYFDIFEIIIIPIAYANVRSKSVRSLFLLLIVLYALSKLYIMLFTYWDLYDPFNTIFDMYITRNLY